MGQPVEGGATLEMEQNVGDGATPGTLPGVASPDGSLLLEDGPESGPEPDSGPTLKGRVKWFDAVKGYGFVVPDDGGDDILIHYNLLAPLGCKALPEGAGIELKAKDGARGRHGTLILNLDFQGCAATMPHDAGESRRRPPGQHCASSTFAGDAGDFEQVEVLWFNRARGYGFLLRGDGVTQIFIHMETVRDCGFAALYAGQDIHARIADGPRGPFAAAIRL